MKRLALIVFVLFLSYAGSSYASTVIATETSRSEYENGKLTYSGKGEFKYRFEIDEHGGKAKVAEYTRLKDNSIIEWSSEYSISYIDDGSSLSGSTLMADKKKANQKVICLIGNPGTLATELIMIGENYFEYCKASSGRFYLATGVVQKSVSAVEDINNQFTGK